MDTTLKGKTALITGGSTELAADIALALAQQGVQIGLCGKQTDLLDLAAYKITSQGGKVLTLVSELDTLEKAEAVVEQTHSTFGGLNILIFVSPFWSGGMIFNHNLKTWDRVINANLREPFLMARAALPVLREQKQGEIVSIGSDSALGIYPQDGAFAVAMHGLTALMELIRAESTEYGIRTHILAPGLALRNPVDAEGKPNLTTQEVADWVLWLLTRPAHLRGNNPILI